MEVNFKTVLGHAIIDLYIWLIFYKTSIENFNIMKTEI